MAITARGQPHVKKVATVFTKTGRVLINEGPDDWVVDAMYGHRRNPKGFGQALMDFDKRLGTVLKEMKPDDLLMITADHGNDPGFRGTDHTRENVPLLVYSPSMKKSNQSLGLRKTFSDLGATILENFNVDAVRGTSFYKEISND